jgi:hypothetical protein
LHARNPRLLWQGRKSGDEADELIKFLSAKRKGEKDHLRIVMIPRHWVRILQCQKKTQSQGHPNNLTHNRLNREEISNEGNARLRMVLDLMTHAGQLFPSGFVGQVL